MTEPYFADKYEVESELFEDEDEEEDDSDFHYYSIPGEDGEPKRRVRIKLSETEED